jgi:tetratricopeptide (TPR) repeat protein
MIKKLFLLSCILGTFLNNSSYAQSRMEIKNTFYDAESWILFEDYKEALPLYLNLIRIYPANSNIKYRIGQCYINTPGEKDKAIRFLEDAVRNINPKYKEGRFSETGAPYDALYYLANAYRINNKLDEALETYSRFKENLDPKVYDSNYCEFTDTIVP